MWTYEQSTGQLYDANMNPVGAPGYSGHPPHVNDPNAQNIPFQGPIPCGIWIMESMIVEGAPQGPYVIVLRPASAEFRAAILAMGRDPDTFLCHGDLVENPGAEMASEGCIIQPKMVRIELYNEPDKKINVVPTVTTKELIQ
jgi:hypothetical protein